MKLGALLTIVTVPLFTVFTVGCEGDQTILYPGISPTSPTVSGPALPGTFYPPTSNPTPLPSPYPNTATRIEFRVTGNAESTFVRYSNALDGVSQVITTLPYLATMTTNESFMFLSIEATPTSYPTGTVYPFFAVQIFVNGVLFRESASNDLTLNTLAVSGTWRK